MPEKNDLKNMLIIITSDEPWGDVWHTQLHYAWQLSKRCMVFYVAPPAKWKFSNLFNWNTRFKKEKENLFIMTYHNVFPVGFMNDFFVMINDLINSLLVKRKIPKEKTRIISWRFTYYRFLHNYFIKSARSVYHVVDHYMGSKNDSRLARQSDLVISTSPKFMDYYKGFTKNVINVPQGINSEEFICDDSVVNKLRSDYGKIILFIGTLSWETNLDIPEQMSDKFPGCTLLIIGPNMLADET